MDLLKTQIKISVDDKRVKAQLTATRQVFTRNIDRMKAAVTSLSSRYAAAFTAMARRAKIAIFAGLAIGLYALVRVVKSGVKEFATFEQGLANVSTMLDKSTMHYMPKYEKAIERIALTYGESTESLTKGLYDILSASVDASKAIMVLEVATKAGRAGLSTTAVAADALTTVINAYGYAAEDAEKLADIMFATVKRGKITFDELASSLGTVVSLAATAGLSFEELAAAVATMTRAGIRSDRAMTSLRSIMIAFMKPTPGATRAALEFGLSLNTATLEAKGLSGVMKDLAKASAEQLAQIFPNIRALGGVAAIRKAINALLKDNILMLKAEGKMNEALAKQMRTAETALKRAAAAWELIKRRIGEALSPKVVELADKLTKWVEEDDEKIRKWIDNIVNRLTSLTETLWNCRKAILAFVAAFVLAPIITGVISLATAVKGLSLAFVGLFSAEVAVAAMTAKMAAAGAIITPATVAGAGIFVKQVGVLKTRLLLLLPVLKAVGVAAAIAFTTYQIYKLIDAVLEYRRVLRDTADVEERYAEIAIKAIGRRRKAEEELALAILDKWKIPEFWPEDSMDPMLMPFKRLTEEQIKASYAMYEMTMKAQGLSDELEKQKKIAEYSAEAHKLFSWNVEEAAEKIAYYTKLLDDMEAAEKAEEIAKAHKVMEDELRRLTWDTTEYQLKHLKERYKAYNEYVTDKVLLADWYAAREKEILDAQKGDYFHYIEELMENADHWMKYLGDKYGEFARKIESSMSDAFMNLTEAGGNWRDALNGFILDVSKSFRRMLSDMAAQALMQAMLGGTGGATRGGPLGWALAGLGKLFGGGAAPSPGVPVGDIQPSMAFMAHSGGVIGVTPMPQRIVPTELFANAPRYHGLQPGEKAIIGKEGEVISNEEPSAAPVININLNAIDTRSGIEFLAQNQRQIAGLVQESMRMNHPSRRSG